MKKETNAKKMTKKQKKMEESKVRKVTTHKAPPFASQMYGVMDSPEEYKPSKRFILDGIRGVVNTTLEYCQNISSDLCDLVKGQRELADTISLLKGDIKYIQSSIEDVKNTENPELKVRDSLTETDCSEEDGNQFNFRLTSDLESLQSFSIDGLTEFLKANDRKRAVIEFNGDAFLFTVEARRMYLLREPEVTLSKYVMKEDIREDLLSSLGLENNARINEIVKAISTIHILV